MSSSRCRSWYVLSSSSSVSSSSSGAWLVKSRRVALLFVVVVAGFRTGRFFVKRSVTTMATHFCKTHCIPRKHSCTSGKVTDSSYSSSILGLAATRLLLLLLLLRPSVVSSAPCCCCDDNRLCCLKCPPVVRAAKPMTSSQSVS